MKTRLSFVAGLVLLGAVCARAELTKEMPISRGREGTAITVSVSTSAWTKANTSTSLVTQRSGYVVTNPAANTQPVYGICHSAAPAEAITVRINEVVPGRNRTFPCGPGLDLYLLALTSSQSVGLWEIGQ